MSKRIDLTGRIFGRITVLRFSHIDEKGKLKWIGFCSCSPEREIIAGHHTLLYGGTKSCGCLKNETTRNQFFDLTGKKIGKLTILELIHRNLEDKTKSIWKCRCECGNEVTRKHKGLLINKGKASCGKGKCNKIFEDLTGKFFGELEVISYEGNGSNNKALYKCKCLCGNLRIARGNNLLSGLAHYCFECAEKNRPRKERHWHWNSEITQDERDLGQNRELMPENTAWRTAVYQRDNYTCQITGVKGAKLCAHHIYNWADNPDKRFDLNNGITILESLHILYHKKYGNRHTTLEQFEEFKREQLILC